MFVFVCINLQKKKKNKKNKTKQKKNKTKQKKNKNKNKNKNKEQKKNKEEKLSKRLSRHTNRFYVEKRRSAVELDTVKNLRKTTSFRHLIYFVFLLV